MVSGWAPMALSARAGAWAALGVGCAAHDGDGQTQTGHPSHPSYGKGGNTNEGENTNNTQYRISDSKYSTLYE